MHLCRDNPGAWWNAQALFLGNSISCLWIFHMSKPPKPYHPQLFTYVRYDRRWVTRVAEMEAVLWNPEPKHSGFSWKLMRKQTVTCSGGRRLPPTLTVIYFLINQNNISNLKRQLVWLLCCVSSDDLYLRQSCRRKKAELHISCSQSSMKMCTSLTEYSPNSKNNQKNPKPKGSSKWLPHHTQLHPNDIWLNTWEGAVLFVNRLEQLTKPALMNANRNHRAKRNYSKKHLWTRKRWQLHMEWSNRARKKQGSIQHTFSQGTTEGQCISSPTQCCWQLYLLALSVLCLSLSCPSTAIQRALSLLQRAKPRLWLYHICNPPNVWSIWQT